MSLSLICIQTCCAFLNKRERSGISLWNLPDMWKLPVKGLREDKENHCSRLYNKTLSVPPFKIVRLNSNYLSIAPTVSWSNVYIALCTDIWKCLIKTGGFIFLLSNEVRGLDISHKDYQRWLLEMGDVLYGPWLGMEEGLSGQEVETAIISIIWQ